MHGCSCVCLMIFVSCMLGFCNYHMVVTSTLRIVSYLCDSFVSVSLSVVFHLHFT